MISDVFSVQWKNAKKRGQTAYKLMKDILRFDQVSMYTDLQKDQVIEKLAGLEVEADLFEEGKLKGEQVGA